MIFPKDTRSRQRHSLKISADSCEPPGYMFLRVLLWDAVPLGGEQRLQRVQWQAGGSGGESGQQSPCPLGRPPLDAIHRQFRLALHRCWPATASQNCCPLEQHFGDIQEMPRENWRDKRARGIFERPHPTVPPSHILQRNDCRRSGYPH